MSAKNDFARSEHGKIKRGRGTISDLLKLPLGNSRCRILGPRYRNASATARQRRNGRSACMDQGGAINAPVPSPPKNTTTTTTTTTTNNNSQAITPPKQGKAGWTMHGPLDSLCGVPRDVGRFLRHLLNGFLLSHAQHGSGAAAPVQKPKKTMKKKKEPLGPQQNC